LTRHKKGDATTEFEKSVRTKAASVVAALARLPEVKGIGCFGSYAVDTCDADSDVDLYVLCQPSIPSSQFRFRALQGIERVHELQVGYVEFGWDNQWCPEGDRCHVDGLLFDISYNTVEWMHTVVEAVKQRGATSIPEFRFRPYTLLGLLDNSVILHDPNSILQTVKSSLYPYPATLRATLLVENLQIARSSLDDLQDYVKRSIGNSAFHFHLSRLLDSLCTIMFALNRRYDPATKRTEEAFRELAIAPDRFSERYDRLLETPLTHEGRKAIVKEFESLLREIEHLTQEKAL
jgi:predicted nucleotidyltransferase